MKHQVCFICVFRALCRLSCLMSHLLHKLLGGFYTLRRTLMQSLASFVRIRTFQRAVSSSF
jgi:hypothetical protein